MRNAVSIVSFEYPIWTTSFPQAPGSWVPSVVWKDQPTIIKLFGVLNKYTVAFNQTIYCSKLFFCFLESGGCLLYEVITP